MSAISHPDVSSPRPPAPRRPQRENVRQSRARRDQLVALALAGAMLIAIFALQPVLNARRASMVQENVSAMRQLSIEFPRLTLTGLRGIITPMLWAHAEEQKNQRQWVELNTTYNMIAKLEPYFVSVYVFNAWNQAYNLSAQWHAIDDKFRWVLDGLDHLYQGEQLNPGAADLELEEAQMYYLKIGNSFERITYRKMWRDHLADQYKFGANPKDPQYDTHMQVRRFALRPEFNAALLRDPEHPTMDGFGITIKGVKDLDGRHPQEANDSMDFRYGVSPFYFAFCEYDRLMKSGHRASTLPPKTADAFRAMSLRMWVHDDTYHLGEILRQLFLPTEPLSQSKITQLYFEAQECARNPPIIEPQCQNLFAENIQNWQGEEKVHRKHMLEVHALVPINAGEWELIQALKDYKAAGDKLTPSAQDHFVKAIDQYNDGIARMNTWINTTWPDARQTDRADPEALVQGLRGRIAGIQKLMTTMPGQKPDLDFLNTDVVER